MLPLAEANIGLAVMTKLYRVIDGSGRIGDLEERPEVQRCAFRNEEGSSSRQFRVARQW